MSKTLRPLSPPNSKALIRVSIDEKIGRMPALGLLPARAAAVALALASSGIAISTETRTLAASTFTVTSSRGTPDAFATTCAMASITSLS